MFKIKFQLINCVFLCAIFLNGCASNKAITSIENAPRQSPAERNQQLSMLNNWQIKGKIGFLQGKKRESASLNWQVKALEKKQLLNLTTYLGINVLQLSSKNGQHNINVDGKSYQSEDLDHLIYSLTGLTLPTEALSFWLKGLAFHPQDKLIYDQITQLPLELESQYDGHSWKVKYSNYKRFDQYVLATKFTIRQADLTIKIRVYNWTL